MEQLKWYYPKDIEELLPKILQDGIEVYGGGTTILKRGFGSIKGLISLDKLNLNYVHENDEFILIGSTTTYREVVDKMDKIDKSSILIKALSRSVSIPLMNRVTVGGSVAAFPIWSDVVGSLTVLDAEVELIGAKRGIYHIGEFLRDISLHKNSFIKEIKFPKRKLRSYYHRATRTNLDYSTFNISMSLEVNSKKEIVSFKGALVGSKERLRRLSELEEILKGKKLTEANAMEFQDFKFNFAKRKLGSPEYLETIANVEVKRGLSKILNT